MYLTPLLNKLVTHTSRLEQSDLGPWQDFWNPEGYGLENPGLPCTYLSQDIAVQIRHPGFPKLSASFTKLPFLVLVLSKERIQPRDTVV